MVWGKYLTVGNYLKCRSLADGDDGLIQAPTGGVRWKHSQTGTSEGECRNRAFSSEDPLEHGSGFIGGERPESCPPPASSEKRFTELSCVSRAGARIVLVRLCCSRHPERKVPVLGWQACCTHGRSRGEPPAKGNSAALLEGVEPGCTSPRSIEELTVSVEGSLGVFPVSLEKVLKVGDGVGFCILLKEKTQFISSPRCECPVLCVRTGTPMNICAKMEWLGSASSSSCGEVDTCLSVTENNSKSLLTSKRKGCGVYSCA
ncbi:uncharacterized protein LOC128076680 isoform X2 [Tympanuchus pallidicinctus]|uniref:uncharacterized protein LOC128076680 isoform X2 n=2 Tax=Tympanuchus pallidicinctus TaxID=109042 RepID=UPI0022874F02|nr:uncharacterized protein LOC128076680 isoform X2 [Tympanuchus pallidicinctus]